MAKVFLVLKVYTSFSSRLPFPSIEHFKKTNISSYLSIHRTIRFSVHSNPSNTSIYQSLIRSDSSNISTPQTRHKAEPKCWFSLMYVYSRASYEISRETPARKSFAFTEQTDAVLSTTLKSNLVKIRMRAVLCHTMSLGARDDNSHF